MEKKRFWLGILAATLILGMTVIGCDDGSTDVDKEEAITLPSTSGEFTFTGIPSKYNGKFALLEGYFSASSSNSSRVMIGFKGAKIYTSNPDYFSRLTCVKIENGTVKIPLYTYLPSSSPASTIQGYTGNDSAYVNIIIYNSETISAATIQSYNAVAIFGTVSGTTPTSFPVQFSSGKASKSNNDATVKLEN